MTARVAPERRLLVTAQRRGGSRIEAPLGEPLPTDPTVEQLRACAEGPAPEGRLWLAGGEPTLRSDLPEVVEAFAMSGPGLCSDGLPLASRSAVAPLRRAGLTGARIALHAARPDAHDWLVGQPGAGRRAVHALRACAAEGMAVEIEATVTRPTMPHLAELCALAAHVGARAVHLRRLTAADTTGDDYRALAPRHGLLEPCLEDAARVASRRGLRLLLHGFPACAAHLLDGLRVAPEHVRWLVPAGSQWDSLSQRLTPASHVGRCGECPAAAHCLGAPADYVATFGWNDFVDKPDGDTGERHHSLRLAFAGPARVACPSCSSGSAAANPEPSRDIRQRLLRAARRGADVLRIASTASLAHPDAPALIGETRLLRFEQVELVSEGSTLAEMPAADLRAMECLTRIDVPLYGPDARRHDAHTGHPGAFEATLRGLKRALAHTGATGGAFAVLHDAADLAEYARAWQDGSLPGAPAFRLSERGDSLETLAAEAGKLPAGAARLAIAALLPPCLLPRAEPFEPAGRPGPAFDYRADEEQPPSGSDRFGAFRPCVCDDPRRAHCPGLAVGWDTELGAAP